jgi:hypothetical protein
MVYVILVDSGASTWYLHSVEAEILIFATHKAAQEHVDSWEWWQRWGKDSGGYALTIQGLEVKGA